MSVLRSTPRLESASSFVLCAAQEPSGKSGEAEPQDSAAKTQDSGNAETGSKIAKHVLTKPDDAAAMWDEVFRSRRPTADQFADAIAYLHEKKQFNVAVEGMLSAIRNGQAAPWMYDVLALEMKLANRPGREIARVLESRIDFATSEPRQLLITAALLSRFEAFDEAVRICQEAVERNPHSSESWLLGRSVSDKSKDVSARVFFRCGILRHVWDKDFELHHAEAMKVIKEICSELDRQGKSAEGQQILEQMQNAAAQDLRINLSWIGPADLDLLITEPGGEKCSYKRRLTANGGMLFREEGVGDSRSSKHVESYVCHSAPDGEYEIAVRFVLGKAVAGTAVLEIIQHAGTPHEKKTSKTVQLSSEDVIVKSVLAGGRAKSE